MVTTLFIDMNAYFASVEQQVRPELRHRPVAVVPVKADSTCCIAASYEAKRFGIKTGTRVGDARRLCPELRLVEARPDLYVRFHHRIVAAVESCLHVAAVHSIDELSCRLMGAEREPTTASELAKQVKDVLRRNVGEYLRCSIGIGPNRLLAKVAGEMRKPDGLVILETKDLPQRLYSLELTDLPGIGPRMRERFRRDGIDTVQQLCALSEQRMRILWRGILGSYWWHCLRGWDWIDAPTRRRTVGHSHVLPPELRTRDRARAVLIRLIHRAAARLRNLRYWTGRISVHVMFLHRGEWNVGIPLGLCQDTLTMVEAFAAAWRACPDGSPLRVGVTLDHLVADASAPLPLFPAERNRVRLARVMDGLNARFGANTIYLADMHEVRETAPRRISFTHIPGLDPTEF